MKASSAGDNSNIQTSELPVPGEIRWDGEYLLWSLQNWTDAKAVRSKRLMFDQFLKLSHGTGDEICNFARRFGMLGICMHHKKPTSHNLICDLIPGPPGWWAEPLDSWRSYAHQFQAVLRIAEGLSRERIGTKEDWALLTPEQDPLFYEKTNKTGFVSGTAGARKRLAGIVNDYLETGGVRPELWTDGKTWRVYYHSIGNEPLFGELASQLMLVVSGVGGYATCSACGDPYPPERSPNPNRYNYCSSECRKKGAAALMVRHRSSSIKMPRIEECNSAEEFLEEMWPVPGKVPSVDE